MSSQHLLRNRFAIIGYGSLIWDLECLTPNVELPWVMAGGPALPMEFSRISPKRKMGLVVVMDPEQGTECATHAVASRRNDIHGAAEDLRVRERAPDIERIGAVCLETDFSRSTHPALAERVREWCTMLGIRGAVWTNLPRNFEASTGRSFSIEAAIAYLRTLQGDSLEEAVRYIDNAPAETDTPLRRVLETHAWWQALARD